MVLVMFVCLFATQGIRTGSSDISDFLHEVKKSNFRKKKSSQVRRAPKVCPINGPKVRFFCSLTKILSIHVRALARKLKLLTFYQNWELRLVFTTGCHHGWWQENFFGATCGMLENAIQGKKYFRAWHYTTHANHHWEIFFSVFIINFRWDME